jgi:enamine deaminase RidA (YjgF/YER057c/UK114 family)
MDPVTKALVSSGTRQALKNVAAILAAAGSSLDRVARV